MTLPPRQQEALDLYNQGLRGQQLADALGLPGRSARKLLARGLCERLDVQLEPRAARMREKAA